MESGEAYDVKSGNAWAWWGTDQKDICAFGWTPSQDVSSVVICKLLSQQSEFMEVSLVHSDSQLQRLGGIEDLFLYNSIDVSPVWGIDSIVE
jgi:hypothetical protein